jgi:nitrite reductase/ring-hydroxylating ferredoxin subunit
MSGLEGFIAVMDEKDLKEGSMKLKSVEGIPVLLIKQNNKIYAMDNRCPHMGCGLSGGKLNEGCIVCPCHDWCFNLETGEYKDEPSLRLKKFEHKAESGKIYVKLDDE